MSEIKVNYDSKTPILYTISKKMSNKERKRLSELFNIEKNPKNHNFVAIAINNSNFMEFLMMIGNPNIKEILKEWNKMMRVMENKHNIKIDSKYVKDKLNGNYKDIFEYNMDDFIPS